MKQLLHVGCGHSRKNDTTAGFDNSDWNEIRLDIDSGVEPDVIGTMTNMEAVPSESVDAIFSSHNIEHLYAHEVPVALSEFLRVLKNDGFAVVTCPDLQSVCQLIAQGKLIEPAYVSSAGPIAPIDLLYGHRPLMAKGNLFMAHRCGFTYDVLMDSLLASGFQSVVGFARPSDFDLWAIASKSPLSRNEMKLLADSHFPS